jgi:AAA+ superfamily predicted ATPase
MLERDESNSVIIAATNHPQALDYALFRRFDDVIEYGLPNRPRIIAVLKFKLSGFKIVKPVWDNLAEIAEGLSHAELTRAVQDAIKDAVIHDRTTLTSVDLKKMLEERQIMKQRKIFSPEK